MAAVMQYQCDFCKLDNNQTELIGLQESSGTGELEVTLDIETTPFHLCKKCAAETAAAVAESTDCALVPKDRIGAS